MEAAGFGVMLAGWKEADLGVVELDADSGVTIAANGFGALVDAAYLRRIAAEMQTAAAGEVAELAAGQDQIAANDSEAATQMAKAVAAAPMAGTALV